MNPKYALFVARDDATLTIDTRSSITPDHLAWFEFLGTLMARALCDCHLVHAPLCAFLFKHILNRSESIGMADGRLRQVDPSYAASMQWMGNNSVDGVLFETFTVLEETDEAGIGAKEEKNLCLVAKLLKFRLMQTKRSLWKA